LLRYSFFINSYPVNALKIARPGPAICDVKRKKDVMNRSCRGVMWCESKPKLAALKIDKKEKNMKIEKWYPIIYIAEQRR
jgi:hypothetical protein